MRKALVTSTALALVGYMGTSAQAAELKQGPYISLFGGANWLDDIDENFFEDSRSDVREYSAEFDLGAVVGGALGYRTAPIGPGHIRGEIEAAYRDNDTDGVIFAEEGCDQGDGCPFMDMSALSVMANLWYDIPIGSSWTVFGGGGVGGASVTGKGLGHAFGGLEAAFENVSGLALGDVEDSDIVFAYQAGAGISYTLPIGAELTLEYRYFATDDQTFDGAASSFPFEGNLAEEIDAEYETHSVMFGLRVPLN